MMSRAVESSSRRSIPDRKRTASASQVANACSTRVGVKSENVNE